MDNYNIDKYKNLLHQLDLELECFSVGDLVYPDDSFILNELQLINFENTAGFKLPQEFKEYCQVFGSGRFGLHGFVIDCPNFDDIEGHLGSNESMLASCQYSFKWSIKELELLKNAYMFGRGNCDVSFIFDLRSYSEEDKSYDIYGLSCGGSGVVYYLGRSFFEFVSEICIGERTKKEFPKLLIVPFGMDENLSINKNTTFIPFPFLPMEEYDDIEEYDD